MFIPKCYDENHPNPIFYRDSYEILNGNWNFKFDKLNLGVIKKYKNGFKKDYEINVPYTYLEKRSGIGITKRVDYVWYQKEINIESLDKNVIIHFEGSDYETFLYVNSKYVGKGVGGYNRHSFDITNYLNVGKNSIIVRCHDNKSVLKPRGKQRFTRNNKLCWYEEATGIYKTVWLEFVPKKRIIDFKLTPSYKSKNVSINIKTNDVIDKINIKISYKEKEILNSDFSSNNNEININVDLKDNFYPWDVFKPELYDIEFNYNDDKVLSYFGIRDIEIKDKKILFNEKELYQKLILDQGYIKDGGLTLTKDELEFDIKSMINMGFNGCRKHQKREADIFYALADFYGYLVWSEMPSFYLFTKLSKNRMEKEWMKIVDELYNHPSIISYTPFNESWGIYGIDKNKKRYVNFVEHIYNKTKEFDPTRLCTTNDGWSNANGDFNTIHRYNQNIDDFKKAIDLAIENNFIDIFGGRKTTLSGSPLDKPILLDEFGGTSFVNDGKSWGYGSNVKDNTEYETRLSGLFETILNDDRIVGYCYTQLSDVRQEMNGLYTMDRKPKIDNNTMKKIQRS